MDWPSLAAPLGSVSTMLTLYTPGPKPAPFHGTEFSPAFTDTPEATSWPSPGPGSPSMNTCAVVPGSQLSSRNRMLNEPP